METIKSKMRQETLEMAQEYYFKCGEELGKIIPIHED